MTDSILAFFHLFMGVLCFVYMICSIRTNIVFFGIFATLVPAFACLAGAFWQTANGNVAVALKLQIAAGALTFVTDMLGWWIFFAIMLASLDFPIQIPGMYCRPQYWLHCANLGVVGDLSHFIKGASEKRKDKEAYSDA